MFGLGPAELILIAVIILLLFGAKRLPDIGKGIGGAIREFKNVRREIDTTKPEEKESGKENQKEPPNQDRQSSMLEARVTDKALEQFPGVKKAVDVKKKADQLKKIVR